MPEGAAQADGSVDCEARIITLTPRTNLGLVYDVEPARGKEAVIAERRFNRWCRVLRDVASDPRLVDMTTVAASEATQ